MKRPAILVVEENASVRRCIKKILLGKGYEVVEEPERNNALRACQIHQPDLVILGSSGIETRDNVGIIHNIHIPDKHVPLFMISNATSAKRVVSLPRTDVNSSIRHLQPFERLAADTERCLASTGRDPEHPYCPGSGTRRLPSGRSLVGQSPAMQRLMDYLDRISPSESNVLITGETGTGKDLVAEYIHERSVRNSKPFVCLNCAAIPDNLLESELFGFERGAFTGAHAAYEGRMRIADGGTLFLDEIGAMSACAQAKFLRVIEDRKICRLGGNRSVAIDVRLVAATNQDLEQLSQENKFRRDLYYRLNVVRVHVPPLRERKEDIPLLLNHYIRDWNARFGQDVQGFDEEVQEFLSRHEWPGNIRELKNLLESIYAGNPPRTIALRDIPEPLRRNFGADRSFLQREKDKILSTLFETRGNKSRAARNLKWSRMTLYRKMDKYRIRDG